MGRLEAFAMQNGPWESFLDGVGNGDVYKRQDNDLVFFIGRKEHGKRGPRSRVRIDTGAAEL